MKQVPDILHVHHIMNGVCMHCDVSSTLSEITCLLVDNNANAVIVRERGVPVGIITARDIVRTMVESDTDSIQAKEIMTSPIVSVEHDSDIVSARQVMVNNNLSKLPVKKEIDIVGLLVQDDIIRDLSWYARF
ncbi:MAG: CBS domain-containing protein [Candidatus Woesearchaeota archaeon]